MSIAVGTTAVADMAAILKNVYIGRVNQLINYETSLSDLFSESDVQIIGGAPGAGNGPLANGNARVVFRINGNKSSTNITQGSVVAASQKIFYAAYNIPGATFNGTCGFTLQADQAAPGSKDLAYVKEADEQTQNLVDELKLFTDYQMYTGNKTKGLINTRDVTGAAVAVLLDTVCITPAKVFQYNGTFDPFLNVVAATKTTWIRVEISRLGNFIPSSYQLNTGLPFEFSYQSVANGMLTSGFANTAQVFVSDFDVANSTITLRVVDIAANAGGQLDLTAPLHPTVLGFAFGLDLADDAGAYIAATPAVGATANVTQTSWQNEANGLLTNLFCPVVFTQDRSSGVVSPIPLSVATRLQSFALTNNDALLQARSPISKTRLQKGLNLCKAATNEQPDFLLAHTDFTLTYLALVQPVVNWLNNVGDKTKADAGVKSPTGKMFMGTPQVYAFAGIPIGTSNHCPPGLLFGHKKSSHKVVRTQSAGQWLTTGTGILYNPMDPTSGRPLTVYEASWVEIKNFYCDAPQKNFAMCGFDLA